MEYDSHIMRRAAGLLPGRVLLGIAFIAGCPESTGPPGTDDGAVAGDGAAESADAVDLAEESAESADDAPLANCGNGIVEVGEECDRDPPQPCATPCGSTGSRACVADCRWAPCVPPSETCNLRDDDCDGDTDETLSKLADDVRVSSEGQRTARPSPVWTGAEFAVAFEDGRDGFDRTEIFLARLSPGGTAVAPDARITDRTDPWGTATLPSLVATPDGFGVAWSDLRDGNSEVYSALLDAAGVPSPTTGLRVTGTAGDSVAPSLTWTDVGFGVAWAECGSLCGIYFARLDAMGAKVGLDVLVSTTEASPTMPALVAGSGEFAVAWTDDRSDPTSWPPTTRDLFFARLGGDGNLVQPETRLAPAVAPPQAPAASLAWTGSEYGLAWPAAMTGAPDSIGVWFVRLDAGGVVIDSPQQVESGTQAGQVDLAWAGDHYALVWIDLAPTPAIGTGVYFARIAASGTPIGLPMALTAAVGEADDPRVAWAGDRYGIVWTDTRDGPDGEAYFVSLGCP